MKVALGLLLAIVAPLCSGCAPGARPASAAVDPVCGIEVGTQKAQQAGLTSAWKETTYYFCSAECRRQFETMPMMYHAKCPVCNLTVQKTAALAAEHDGRTYFFDSAEHRAAFIKEPVKYLGELAMDVVCGMEVVKSKAVEAGLTAEHEGKTYYFCGPGCREKLLKAPDQYTGDRTAICPVCGMSVVKMQAEAERLTSVYQGNTYYFCASGCQRYFDRNPEKYLKQR